MILPSTDEFIAAAREFCSFAKDENDLAPSDLWKVRDLLLRLITHIPAVESMPQGFDYDGISPDDAICKRVAMRFNDLPFNFYRVVFDPHNLDPADEPVMGMLADDLSDIFRELAGGLDCADRGYLEEACFEWSFGYRSHWARHAVNALMAIEIRRTDNFESTDRPNSTPPSESNDIHPQ